MCRKIQQNYKLTGNSITKLYCVTCKNLTTLYAFYSFILVLLNTSSHFTLIQ